MKYLDQGDPVSPAEILDQREQRAEEIYELSQRYPKQTLISFKLNIPGPIKNNEMILRIFDQGVSQIQKILSEPVVCSLTAHKTGPEIILRSIENARSIKEKMIALEESSPLARLYDIDVLFQGEAVSREQLMLPVRRCFICDQPAKVCARSRRHTVNEMLIRIEELIEQDPGINAKP